MGHCLVLPHLLWGLEAVLSPGHGCPQPVTRAWLSPACPQPVPSPSPTLPQPAPLGFLGFLSPKIQVVVQAVLVLTGGSFFAFCPQKALSLAQE